MRWTRQDGHCWWSKDKLITKILLWTPTNGHTSVDQPVKNYIDQFCVNTRCCVESQPRTIGTDSESESKESILLECLDEDDHHKYKGILLHIYISTQKKVSCQMKWPTF